MSKGIYNGVTPDGSTPANSMPEEEYRDFAVAQVSAGRASRFNAGKINFTLLPVDALAEEAKVWMSGRIKYPREDRGTTKLKLGNWEQLWGEDTVETALSSLLRHAFAIQSGEWIDEETKHQHAAHIRCNAAMLIRYYNQKVKETK